MTELIICTTCRPADNPREQRAAGDLLLEAVQAEQAFGDRPEWAAVRVRGVACTAGCSRACTVAFQAPDKHSYQFGDLRAGDNAARALLDCAVLHLQSPDGNLARDARPPLLRNGILCRLPPTIPIPETRHESDDRTSGHAPPACPAREGRPLVGGRDQGPAGPAFP